MTDTPELIPSSEPVQASAGQLLRQARQGAGVHLAILSAALKVPVKTLEQLETDQHQGLGAPAFVRALAGSVCRQLQIDPQPILARLPQSGSQLKPAPVPLDAENRGLRRHPSSVRWPKLRWREPLLWVGLAMLALTAVLIWWPDWLHNPLASIDKADAAPKTVAESPASPLPMEPASEVAMGQATEGVQAPVPAVPAVAASVPAASSAPAAVSATTVALAQEPKPAAPAAPVLMGVSANAESWVEVRDAAGQVLLSKLMKPGERESVAHGQVLRVVIGRADAVSVEVKGKPFDLKPHTQVTVARFEVQP